MIKCSALLLSLVLIGNQVQANNKAHAIAMHGDAKYASDFTQFDYTSSNAKKGGTLRLAVQGGFDSLNPFIPKGSAGDYLGLIYDSLTTSSADEAFTQYGLIAKTIEWPEDRSWVKYTLRKDAKFSDGTALTAEDVKFSFDTLLEKGAPFYKTVYGAVTDITVHNKYELTYRFKDASNKELALIVGQLPVFPKHYWKDRDFSQSSLDIPMGSGPYKIKEVKAGKKIVFERNKDYWAKDLAVNKGKYNFDIIDVDYYRDSTVLLEALKANEYDIRRENVSKLWATGYNIDAVKNGKIVKERIKHSNPTGMQAFVLNLRKPKFQDIRVRKALTYAFDYEWTNKTLFYNAYTRTNSYFSNSELASSGLPSADELALLNPLKADLPATVFTEAFTLPQSDGSGNNRKQLRTAKKLLEEAGWKVVNNKLTNKAGDVFTMEFLIVQPTFERVINPYISALKRLGIQASIRKVEVSQYINRARTFNFDVMVSSIGQSLSPGTEQIQYWHSSTADIESSRNLAGIKNPAIDVLIKHVVEAKDREALVTATKALDRALLHNWFVIPQWHIDAHRVAHWNKFGKPSTAPKYDPVFDISIHTWWFDEKLAKENGIQ